MATKGKKGPEKVEPYTSAHPKLKEWIAAHAGKGPIQCKREEFESYLDAILWGKTVPVPYGRREFYAGSRRVELLPGEEKRIGRYAIQD